MYGMELSVLLPLLGGAAVHAARPFFPEDIARTLFDASVPRLLVTTPVHLRALVASEVRLPELAGIVSATAPLSTELAAAAEARFGCEVRELFGSTETCVIARRRTARESAWTPLPGVRLAPQPDGTAVHGAHLPGPVTLADLIELVDNGRLDNGSEPDGRFHLRGRNADLLEIAGKRASLGDMTRKLLAIPGVEDGVVFQLDEAGPDGVRRIAALAVAPDLDERTILAALRTCIDPVFLPRPLKRIPHLPRSETGKLPRLALVALLQGSDP
jgi:acyl-coenzyme A synthetase/AMP-(fatty) acid ligase